MEASSIWGDICVAVVPAAASASAAEVEKGRLHDGLEKTRDSGRKWESLGGN